MSKLRAPLSSATAMLTRRFWPPLQSQRASSALAVRHTSRPPQLLDDLVGVLLEQDALEREAHALFHLRKAVQVSNESQRLACRQKLGERVKLRACKGDARC